MPIERPLAAGDRRLRAAAGGARGAADRPGHERGQRHHRDGFGGRHRARLGPGQPPLRWPPATAAGCLRPQRRLRPLRPHVSPASSSAAQEQGQCLNVLAGHTGAVNSVAVDRHGKIAVTAGADGTGRVWDVRVGTCVQLLLGHTSLGAPPVPGARPAADPEAAAVAETGGRTAAGALNKVILSRDSSRAVTCSSDFSARAWEVRLSAPAWLCAPGSRRRLGMVPVPKRRLGCCCRCSAGRASTSFLATPAGWWTRS